MEGSPFPTAIRVRAPSTAEAGAWAEVLVRHQLLHAVVLTPNGQWLAQDRPESPSASSTARPPWSNSPPRSSTASAPRGTAPDDEPDDTPTHAHGEQESNSTSPRASWCE
ncbi:hypothetical protein NKH18_48710 [Streptomyces sp. M10(2022)]